MALPRSTIARASEKISRSTRDATPVSRSKNVDFLAAFCLGIGRGASGTTTHLHPPIACEGQSAITETNHVLLDICQCLESALQAAFPQCAIS